MRILLDTHTLLWFVAGDTQLSDTARLAIESTDNEPVVSMASIWETGIKVSLGKLDLGMDVDQFVAGHVLGNGFGLPNITVSHVAHIVTLPLHHRDPFDRLLISQALSDGLPIVGSDPQFAAYGVSLIW